MSWYKSIIDFSERQKWYLNLLEDTFVIRDAQGRKVKYVLQDYQRDYHAHSLLGLAEKDWKNRLVVKSRGIGLSVMTLIDYICYSSSGFFENTVFPITSYRQDASIELIRKAKNIILDTEEEMRGEDKHLSFDADIRPTGIYFKETGCFMKAMPGGSDEALRSYRSPGVLLDEIAFYIHGEELFAAGENVVTEGGGIDIISTIMGFNDFFSTLVQSYKKNNLGYVFEFPLYKQAEFNPNLPLTEQKGESIAPWLKIEDLEKRRIRDVNKFLREYQCIPVDVGSKFYPLPLIIDCVIGEEDNKMLVNRVNPYNLAEYKVVGIDVASIQDYAAFAEFTNINGIWFMTYLDKQQMPLPQLQDYFAKLIETRNPTLVQIDATGQGLQLSQYLVQKFGTKINPIQFATKIDTQKVREFAAINLRTMMYEKKVWFKNDESLINHLNGWSADLNKFEGDGHGDIAVACELALIPNDKIPRAKDATTVSFAGFAKRFGGNRFGSRV